MDIHFKDGEKLTVYVQTPGGETKTFVISYQEMMERGEVIVDGLTATEIRYLGDKKKIQSIKLYRARTGVGIRDAKIAVEEWTERHNCCKHWPFCEHMKCVEHLDTNRGTHTKKGLTFIWTYPEELTLEQAHAIMSLRGYSSDIYGCYSYIVENGETRWASNIQPRATEA